MDGDRRNSNASMREVAELAGVAISSVSRVLSGHPDVSAEMRERVLQAVEALRYEPDFLGQSLRRGATLSVGYVVSDISNPLHSMIASGAESVLRRAGYSMVLMNSEGDPSQDAAHIRFFHRRRVDGFILSLASEQWEETNEVLGQLREPVVLVDREGAPGIQVSHARNDHQAGVRAAMNHLLDLGHRRIAIISGVPDLWPVRERILAMQEAVAERGLDDETVSLLGSLSAEHGEHATDTALAMRPRPTALIAGGNQVLAGCLRSLSRHEVEIPRDLSLVTCDDIPLAELHSPPISAVTRDLVRLGHVAARLLLERLAGKSPEIVTLPTDYVPRASCAAPPID